MQRQLVAGLAVLLCASLLLVSADAVREQLQRRLKRTDRSEVSTTFKPTGFRYSLTKSIMHIDKPAGLEDVIADPMVKLFTDLFANPAKFDEDVEKLKKQDTDFALELKNLEEKILAAEKKYDELDLAIKALQSSTKKGDAEKLPQLYSDLFDQAIIQGTSRQRVEEIRLARLGFAAEIEEIKKEKQKIVDFKSLPILKKLFDASRHATMVKKCAFKFQVLGAGPVGLSTAIELSLLGCTVHLIETRPHPVMQHVVNMVDTSTQENHAVPEFKQPKKGDEDLVDPNELNVGMRRLFMKLFDMSDITVEVDARGNDKEESVVMTSVRDIQLYLMFAFSVLKQTDSTFSRAGVNRDNAMTPATSNHLWTALDQGHLVALPGVDYTMAKPVEPRGREIYFFVLRDDVDFVVHATSSTLRANIFDGDLPVEKGEFSLNVLNIKSAGALKTYATQVSKLAAITSDHPDWFSMKFQISSSFENLFGKTGTQKAQLEALSALAPEAIKYLPTSVKQFWAAKEGVATIMMNFPTDKVSCKAWHGPAGSVATTFPDDGDGGTAPMIRAAGVFTKSFIDSRTGKEYCQFELTMQPAYSRFFMRYFGAFRFPSIFKDTPENAQKAHVIMSLVTEAAPDILQKVKKDGTSTAVGTIPELFKVVREIKIWKSQPHMLMGQSAKSNTIPFAAFKNVVDGKFTKQQYHIVAGDAVRDPFTFFAMGVNDGYAHAVKFAKLVEAELDQAGKAADIWNTYNANIALRELIFTSVIQRNAFGMFNGYPDGRKIKGDNKATSKITFVFELDDFNGMSVKV